MNKHILIFLFTILAIALFVSCDSSVNDKLFSENSEGEALWTIKITSGTDVYYSKDTDLLPDSILYLDPQCESISQKILKVVCASSEISFQHGGEDIHPFSFDSSQVSAANNRKIFVFTEQKTFGTSSYVVLFNPGTYTISWAS